MSDTGPATPPPAAGGTPPPAAPPPADPPAPPAPEFKAPQSQEELNRIVNERLARQKAQFADYDTFKTKAEQFDKLDESNKSELQKAQDAATAAEQQRADIEAKYRNTLVSSAVIAEASKQGAVDPSAVAALLASDAVTIDDAGQVTGAETAVKQLLTDKPYLLAAAHHPANGVGDGGSKGGAVPQLTREQYAKLSPQQAAEAEQKGQLAELLGGSRK